jgi:hypothetical protein
MPKFWQRASFWACALGTIPLVFALFRGTVTPEMVISVVAAWGAFFTSLTPVGPKLMMMTSFRGPRP